jgi:thiol:disulfide interchange protein DsbA
MQRREILTKAGFSAVAAATVSPSQLWAQAARPQLGTDFLKLDAAVPVEAGAGKVEVVEFFSYMCPHCSAFEPAFSAWAKKVPKNVVVHRVPVHFLPNFEVLQRMYYAIEAMNMVETLHAKVFAAVHVEHRSFGSADIAADWVASQGVDRAKFLAQFNSFAVATRATRAKQLTTAYAVDGVPALGVAGRYYTDGALAKSMDRALQVVDFLINEVRSGR